MMLFVYKGHAHQIYGFCHDFNYHINERETPKTCLTNHQGSISHHIMPLIINSPGVDTQAHTHTHILTLRTKAISRNHAGMRWPRVLIFFLLFVADP